MRVLRSSLLFLATLSLVACSFGSNDPPDGSVDEPGVDAGDAGADDGEAGDPGLGDDMVADAGGDFDFDTLFGVQPKENLEAPGFSARNLDGSSRSRPDLIGHASVIWFYPMANTSG